LLLVGSMSLVISAPAAEAKRPPRPIVKSHGVKVKAGYIAKCPRRSQDPPCAMPDFFATTEPVPVHPGGVLRINTRRRARRLRLDLDCPRRKVEVIDRTRWTFELPSGGCTIGELNITYRRVVARLTFNLRRHEHCQPDGSQTVTANESARVYSVYSVRETEDGTERENAFFACRFDSGKSEQLGYDYCCDYSGEYFFDHPVLVDEKVAYVQRFEDNRYGNQKLIHLRVFDLATFRVERDIYLETPSPSGDYDLVITAVVLKANGSIAWILHRCRFGEHGPCTTQTYDVRKSDQTGDNLLVESSADIDPGSLGLSGSTLTWIRGGELRTAALD
jgi:hypothetical protein